MISTPDPSLPTADHLRPRLGRYQLLRLVGEGGIGQVYLAEDEQLGRRVAVKVLPAGRINDAGAVARFQREARALAQLAHPNIVQAHDSGEHDGRHFLVMEYVEGRNLGDLLEEGRLAPARAADYAHQAALALQHAHERGLVHRDVKPSNLLVMSDGRVKLLDLGLARFLQDQLGEAGPTREGVGMGTPDYAAPEQARDAHGADHRADVYSLGCTLYHLLAGRVPFPTSSAREKWEAHERREPTPLEELCPEAPGGLVLAVGRMMAKRPADRFASAAEAAEALFPFVAGSSPSFQTLKSTGSWHRGQLTLTEVPRRRWRPVLAALAAVLLVALGAGVSALVLWKGDRRDVEPLAQGDGGQAGSERPPAGVKSGGARDDKPKEKEKEKQNSKAEEEGPSSPDDPDVLTVAQKGRAKYRTIGAALEAVKPGQTIRVVDDAVYRESLHVNGNTRFAGVRLEAPRGATLAVPLGEITALDLKNVRGVSLRGFRLSAPEKGTQTYVGISEDCGAIELEGLSFEGDGPGLKIGLVVVGPIEVPASGPVVAIRGCTFNGLTAGIMLQGCLVAGETYGRDTPVRGVFVEGNTFSACTYGCKLRGQFERVQIVANRVTRAKRAGVDLEHIAAASKQLLIANNTFDECNLAVRSWDTGPRCGGVRLSNNLILASAGPDLLTVDSGGHTLTGKGPGDGPAFAAKWQMACNWREVKEPKDKDGWVPLSAKDVRRDEIKDVVRVGGVARPKAGSELATKGAGTFDPSLPRYVGALPPEGTPAWDWSRTWLAPPPGKLITVSKRASDKADHETLAAALEAAEPWATIRVLDDAAYEESLTLDDEKKHTGVVIEGNGKAAVVLNVPIRRAVTVQGVAHVRLRGLVFRDKGALIKPGRAHVYLGRRTEGAVVEDCRFEIGTPVVAVEVGGSGTERAPVVVRRCEVAFVGKEYQYDGIVVLPGSGQVSRFVRIEGNVLRGLLRAVLLQGDVDDVHVVGNRVRGSHQAGLQTQDLSGTVRRVVLANNTVLDCNSGLRFWEHHDADQNLLAARLGVINNLFAECPAYDVGYTREKYKQGEKSLFPTLYDRWAWRGNVRDLTGSGTGAIGGITPLAATDRRFDPNDWEKIEKVWYRPKDVGGAAQDRLLPRWVGALPPAGTPAWDWERTWRQRIPVAVPAAEKKKP